MTKLKLLIVMTGGLFREGITTTQYEFLRIMDKTDMQIDVASVVKHNEEIIQEFKNIGCNVIEFPNRKENTRQYIKALRKVLKEGKYDIIHVHGSSSIMAIELRAAKTAKVKVRIAHSRNTICTNKKANKLLRPFFSNSYNVAFACGEDAGKWLFRDKPFTVIHNGKDLGKFHFSSEKRKKIRDSYKITDDIKAIGFVGNLNEQKNPEYLLDIFKAIYDRDNKTHFFIMGDGGKRQLLEEKVKTIGIDDVVTFTGRISNVNEMLQAMDVMLLPSRWEGLPNVVLEWQAACLPCVISDKITRECAVSDLVNFMSIDIPPEEWAEKVLSIEPVNRTEKSLQVQQQLKDSGFDLEEGAKRLKKLYFDLVEKYK